MGKPELSASDSFDTSVPHAPDAPDTRKALRRPKQYDAHDEAHEPAPADANDANDELLRPRETCEWLVRARRAAVLIDAARYYAVLREVIPRARHSIFIVGWDIDSRIELVPGGAGDGLPDGLADFLCAAVDANPHLRIHVLGWDFAMLYAFEREWLPSYQPSWHTHRRLSFRLDGRHPLGASHHQKIVVIDDCLAFTGGIDLTSARWDTPAHAPDDPARRNPGKTRYQPIHDVQMMFDGPAAGAMARLVHERWQRSRRSRTAPRPFHPGPVNPHLWPSSVTPDFVDIDLGIALTEPAYEGREAVHQVRALHVAAVAAARRNIYIENQYFTAGAIGTALCERIGRTPGPDVAVVCPFKQSGWLQEATMGVLRARLHRLIQDADPNGRYAMYAPAIDAGRGVFVNVHSKVMIVDERVLLIGTANLNNRSMVLDTECCVAIDARGNAQAQATIARIRNALLAEHLDTSEAEVAQALERHGRLNPAIASLKHGARTLVPLTPEVAEEFRDFADKVHVLDAEAPIAPDELIRQFLPEPTHRSLTARLLVLGALALAVVALTIIWRFTPAGHPLSFTSLTHGVEQLAATRLGPAAVVAGYALAALLSVPVTLLIAVTGFVFGALTGAAYAMAGTLIAAAAGWAVGAWLGRDAVRELAGPKLNRLSERLHQKGLLAVIVLRLVPAAPFSIVNLAAGASRIRFRDFFAGTAIGMAPGVVLATSFAHQLVSAVRHPTPFSLMVVAAIGVALVGLSLLLRRILAGRR
ncbi:VTT domain-containing protein [Paraburkholderia terricola]|uniref:Phosphatidylserine/phosphatidylglycerophosphate/ cardiolipin synthase-like enzyme/uncharacterized membrane protein YdjX (TVP38/TMEM64 family) n=1 Tax=Paraburkholderia terricola TaxID=169427 RepID=A0ABU1LY82_9BURK|nr:VTT domain-containing protein [Paraburkholderia terricola]MDR6411712.1 phosphatidylserine/phosphatidylglycerophosphate/cardiolipin synthase-like enzyme/uncharacterized membrane protein YdjX (TVP38/TMEM64 family) [Paraburkholderia terricola]MDR6484005.1 phosphatidylserine/phosphatidylglycerophosphate/cardiolipin synthase-like enzyme/uncharacterized membrane protein YdjX (TVP38/TMEM64 family) [Paraburkholderia terricola]